MKGYILVVDDEKEIADLLELYLTNEGFTVYKCYDAKTALNHIQKDRIDLAILDVMLPDMSGFSICTKIREKYTYPIIMLTARDGEIDKINGLTYGADDYITKPFRPLEMIARVKAQLRRYLEYSGLAEKRKEVIQVDGIVLDVKNHECRLNDEVITLTPTEFTVLKILSQRKGEAVSAEDIFHELWGDEYYSKSNNSISVHIRHVREKLGDTADKPKYIKTVWGVGYKIGEK